MRNERQNTVVIRLKIFDVVIQTNLLTWEIELKGTDKVLTFVTPYKDQVPKQEVFSNRIFWLDP